MEPTHIFFKELRIDKNNVFTANILEKNEVENVILKKIKNMESLEWRLNLILWILT